MWREKEREREREREREWESFNLILVDAGMCACVFVRSIPRRMPTVSFMPSSLDTER